MKKPTSVKQPDEIIIRWGDIEMTLDDKHFFERVFVVTDEAFKFLKDNDLLRGK